MKYRYGLVMLLSVFSRACPGSYTFYMLREYATVFFLVFMCVSDSHISFQELIDYKSGIHTNPAMGPTPPPRRTHPNREIPLLRFLYPAPDHPAKYHEVLYIEKNTLTYKNLTLLRGVWVDKRVGRLQKGQKYPTQPKPKFT